MTTPENITQRSDLPENGVFVFGSNLMGHHKGGAAKVAKDEFGAVEGMCVGLIGESYAFPTLDKFLQQRSLLELLTTTIFFYSTVQANPSLTFYLTRVGCGIAGYDEEYMKKFFAWDLPNLVKPPNW
jgi:hypothetical protein